jgi:diguanylate cyclase (GGDEF)-like protein
MLSYKKVIIFPLLIASLLLTVAMAWIFFTMSQLIQLTTQKDKVDVQRYNISALNHVITNAESGQRGYLLTNNATFLEAYDAGKVAVEDHLERIVKLNENFPELVLTFSKVRSLVNTKFDLMSKGIQVQLRSGAYASHLTLVKDGGKLLMAEISLELAKADALLYEARLRYEREIDRKIKATIYSGVILVLLICGIFLHSYKRTLVLFEKVSEGEVELNSLSHLATHDSLTGLVNRRGFEEYFMNTYVNTARRLNKCAVLYLDLDGFKIVNDTYGHKLGDKLLIKVAQLFSQVIREYDFIARLGGDEFVLVVDRYEDRHELTLLAERLIAILDQPLLNQYQYDRVGVSIGIATYPEDTKDVFALLTLADEAMYQAKEAGKNKWSFVTA